MPSIDSPNIGQLNGRNYTTSETPTLPGLDFIDSSIPTWLTSEFAYPKQKIRIGTLFSGIGALEHAMARLNLHHEIVLQTTQFVKKIGTMM